MKRFAFMAIGLSLIVFITIKIMADWDFSKIGNPESYGLSGTFQTKDERVQFELEKMDVTHEGVSIQIRYELDNELKELGFEYSSIPSFSIVENPEQLNDEVHQYRLNDNRVYAEEVEKRSDANGNYFVAFFPYGDIKHQSEVGFYRFYLENPGAFVKEIQKVYDVEIGKTKEIIFNGIGSYEVDLRFNINEENSQLIVNSETNTFIGNPFQVDQQIMAIDNKGNMIHTKGGSGIGSRSGESPIWEFEGKYMVDENFIDADTYQLKVLHLNLDIASDSIEKEYIDLHLDEIN